MRPEIIVINFLNLYQFWGSSVRTKQASMQLMKQVSIFIFLCDITGKFSFFMQNELSVKGLHSNVSLYRWYYYVTTTVQFLASSMSSSIASCESLPARWVYSVRTLSMYFSQLLWIKLFLYSARIYALGLHCCQKKQSCPPWESDHIFLLLPFLVLALVLGRMISFYLSEAFVFSGLWFSTESAGQSGTAPNPVMTGTHTRELMAIDSREEADSDWLKLIMRTNPSMKAAGLC